MVNVQITSLGSSGVGVGKIEGYTLFVENALPGETVTVQLVEKKPRYGIGKLKTILTPSPDRVEPICRYFGSCGGCQLMHLSYAKQLEAKRQQVVDALKRIGHLDLEIPPCLPSPKKTHYRNKIQLPIQKEAGALRLGLYKRSSHELIPINKCHIHTELGNQVYQKIAPLIAESQVEGLRHLLIKTSLHFQESLVILVTEPGKAPDLRTLGEKILQKEPLVKGVIQNEHAGSENVILGPTYQLLAGEGSMQEKIGGLLFRVSPASFFQVNPFQAEILYAKALEWAELTGKEKVIDAYCGVGTLSLLFASSAKEIIGIESVPKAIEDAKKNAEINRIKNSRFFCGKAEKLIQKQSHADLILINPPRKGCDPQFIESVGRLLPLKLLYISCNPATLARDIKELYRHGYKVDKLQPFDMFPQTSHVETLVLLSRKLQ